MRTPALSCHHWQFVLHEVSGKSASSLTFSIVSNLSYASVPSQSSVWTHFELDASPCRELSLVQDLGGDTPRSLDTTRIQLCPWNAFTAITKIYRGVVIHKGELLGTALFAICYVGTFKAQFRHMSCHYTADQDTTRNLQTKTCTFCEYSVFRHFLPCELAL